MKSPLPTIVCIFQLCATPLLYGEGKNTTVKHTCCIKKKPKRDSALSFPPVNGCVQAAKTTFTCARNCCILKCSHYSKPPLSSKCILGFETSFMDLQVKSRMIEETRRQKFHPKISSRKSEFWPVDDVLALKEKLRVVTIKDMNFSASFCANQSDG